MPPQYYGSPNSEDTQDPNEDDIWRQFLAPSQVGPVPIPGGSPAFGAEDPASARGVPERNKSSYGSSPYTGDGQMALSGTMGWEDYEQPNPDPYGGYGGGGEEESGGGSGGGGESYDVLPEPIDQGGGGGEQEQWSQGGWDADRVRRYFASRGVTPNSTSPDYWAQKWQEWGQRDPAYFLRFLSNAEEITGSANQTSLNMFGVPNTGGGGGGGFGGGGGGAWQNPQIQDAIQRLLSRGETPVTGRDVQDRYQPAASSLERGGVLSRAQSAQRRAAEGTGALGGGGGANSSDLGSINEDIAMGQSSLMAQLMGDEIQARRADVVNALQFAQGDQRMQLEQQLAQMDNELRRLQVNNQNQQFYDRFSYDMGRDTREDDILDEILRSLG